MEKVLVTGGAGYIGSILTKKLLDKNYKVTVLDSLIYNQNSLNDCCVYPNFNFINGDICNYSIINDLLKDNDIIIPLAAIVGAPACDSNKSLSKSINLDAHINIIKNLSNSQMIIFPNTNSGYGIGKKNEFCDESSTLNPVSLYGKWKVEVEKELIKINNSVSLRLATVFGVSPRMRTDLLVNDFVLRSLKDNFLILFEENFRRNFIHIRDIANTFIFCIENITNLKNDVYNVGLSSANLTKRELAEKIKVHLPKLNIFSSEIAKDPDKRDYVVSNKKLESKGWKTQYTLDDGIIELIKCYKFLNLGQHKNI